MLKSAACAVLTAVGVAAAAPAALGREPQPLSIRLFATIGPPGQPEPVAIGPDGRIYVGTNQQQFGFTDRPSKVFAFSRSGRLVRQYTLAGQDLGRPHGIQGLAFDGSGLLHVLDRSARPRDVMLDPLTGRQSTYATFRDVPRCQVGRRPTGCQKTTRDTAAGPDYMAFAPGGALYVTDIEQALIWRVPKGGGRARVWFADPRLEGAGDFGPNGAQFLRDGRTLVFANTFYDRQATGALSSVRVRRDGRAGRYRLLWRSRLGDGPDGIAIARSGNVYVALASANAVAVISPRWREIARSTAKFAADERGRRVAITGPASLAFVGRRLLMTDQCPLGCTPPQWAVVDVYAGERGLPLYQPVVAPGRLRPRRT